MESPTTSEENSILAYLYEKFHVDSTLIVYRPESPCDQRQ